MNIRIFDSSQIIWSDVCIASVLILGIIAFIISCLIGANIRTPICIAVIWAMFLFSVIVSMIDNKKYQKRSANEINTDY